MSASKGIMVILHQENVMHATQLAKIAKGRWLMIALNVQL